eukprot:GEMP01070886.1.p1 GENE.GEMP01070886.1~~GEMP01070886.1.p1  ORF type:complete len:265 (+),score=54.42 GEMP01070886.1:288-1082(+)
MKKSVTFTAMPDVGRQTHVGDIHFAAQDVSSPSTVVDSEADSLHTATHAGSTIQRPMAVAAKKSPLEDVDLSALFLVPQNRKSPHMRQFLFKEIKKRLIRKYGSLERAFLSVDISGDGSISFNEFHSLLKSMHIILTNRFSRSLFDKVSGGDKMLSYDEFVTALMASTLEKVTLQMKQIDRNSLLGWEKADDKNVTIIEGDGCANMAEEICVALYRGFLKADLLFSRLRPLTKTGFTPNPHTHLPWSNLREKKYQKAESIDVPA